MDDYGHACSASRDCTLHNLQCDYPDCAKGKRIGIHAAIGKPNYVQSPDFVAGYKAGREAGMRRAAEIAKARDLVAYGKMQDYAESHKCKLADNQYLLGRGDEAHGAYAAILSAIEGAK